MHQKQIKPAQIDKKIKALSQKIAQDPYNQKHGHDYVQRSQQFQLKGDFDSAITDLSKSLCIDPTFEGYVKRGKLYASSDLFYCAMMDFEEADRLFREEQAQAKAKTVKVQETEEARKTAIKNNKEIDPQTQKFLKQSTVIIKLPELKKIAKQHQKSKQFLPAELNIEFKALMTKMIEERVHSELKQMKQQNKNYEQLLQLVKRQQQKIGELEEEIQNKTVDYEGIFHRQIDLSMLSEANKEKCTIYFNTVVSQMEKFYLSAKVLSEFDEKISFEDYETKIKDKTEGQKQKATGFSGRIVEKIFKLFQKHEDKIQRLEQIIKEIPYIGTAFKLIKPSLKICGWIEQVKLESECENILSVRPSVASFNKLSAKIAYQMYKYFKVNITTQSKMGNSEIYHKNCWQKIAKVYHKFKRNQMAARVFSHVKPEQKNYAEEMGNIHTSILMIGVAYGIFQLPSDTELESGNWQKEIFEKIAEMQESLWKTQSQIQVEEIGNKTEANHSKGCAIF